MKQRVRSIYDGFRHNLDPGMILANLAMPGDRGLEEQGTTGSAMSCTNQAGQ